MPLQNRVLPDGSIVAAPQRGTMMGNRGGAFHTDDQCLMRRHWHSRQWICCSLSFKDRHRRVMQPRRYTELFFLDEATALAAGHRPCFECRRADAERFAACWSLGQKLGERARAADMDAVLHAERLTAAGVKRTWRTTAGLVPAGCMIRLGDGFGLVCADGVKPWSLDGYAPCRPLAARLAVEVLNPPSIVAALAAGYPVGLHKTAAS